MKKFLTVLGGHIVRDGDYLYNRKSRFLIRCFGSIGMTASKAVASHGSELDYEIRRPQKENKMSQRFLGKKYGVNKSVIGDVLNNRTWKHVI